MVSPYLYLVWMKSKDSLPDVLCKYEHAQEDYGKRRGRSKRQYEVSQDFLPLFSVFLGRVRSNNKPPQVLRIQKRSSRKKNQEMSHLSFKAINKAASEIKCRLMCWNHPEDLMPFIKEATPSSSKSAAQFSLDPWRPAPAVTSAQPSKRTCTQAGFSGKAIYLL